MARRALPTILGQGALRISVAGKIRAGIKVLTKAAASNAKAKAIYDEGVAKGLSFEDIERQIAEALPELKTPLVPKNVPWFTVRAGDFPNPETARQIMDAYGEDRGDGECRLYRFPVVFPADQWQLVMPHELVAWGAAERKFWSEYSPDGRVRFCKRYAPVPKDASGKRAIRVFGGRKALLRADNEGLCNPEACREYQARQCNLSGRFIFYIPGIRSIDAFELGTNSFYAMNAAIRKFETLAFLRGGRISGFLDNRGTPFYLTKKLMEVSRIDEEGRAVRAKQWIIELEAPVDVTALLRASEDDESVLANGDRAAQVLQGSGVTYEADEGVRATGNDTVTRVAATQQPTAGHDEANPPTTTASLETGAAPPPKTTQVAASQAAPKPQGNGATSPSLEELAVVLKDIGIEPQQYCEYADKRRGSGWKNNANARRHALEEIESFRGDPDGLRAKIDGEKVFS